MTDLNGKSALVTGASSGIGHATALAMAREGIAVALTARRRERLEALAKQIVDEGQRAIVIEADVSDERQAAGAVAQTQEAFGRFDILVNNAGAMLLGRVHRADTAEWRRMIDVNLMGLLYCTHAALGRVDGFDQDEGGGESEEGGEVPLRLLAA